MALLTVELLGGFRVSLESGQTLAVPTRKRAAPLEAALQTGLPLLAIDPLMGPLIDPLMWAA